MRNRPLALFKIFIFSFLLSPAMIFSQEGVNGETEIGTDGKRGEFFSQFLNYDGKRLGLVARYFKIEKTLERGEFALGPNVATGALKVGLRCGYCTDHEVMTNFVACLNLSKTAVATYIFEGKFSTNDTTPHTFYQKFSFPLTPQSNLFFRVENLWVNRELSFLRIGAEYEYNLPHQSHFFIAPFYDTVIKKVGLQGGLRFL